MIFWYGYYLFIAVLVISSYLFPRFTREMKYLFLILLWGIASFRYMYGADYGMYEMLYEARDVSGVLSMAPSIEPTFLYMVQIYNDLGLEAQFLFLTYASIILVFFYKGCVSWFPDSRKQLTLLILYATATLTGGYFFGLNGIRQSAAISILFWGTHFLLYRERIKFFLAFLIAFLFHYSSVFFLPACLMMRRKIPYSYAIGLVCASLISTLSGISEKVFLQLLTIAVGFSNAYGRYEDQLTLLNFSGGFPSSTLFVFLSYMALLALIRWKHIRLDDRKGTFLYNASTIYVTFRCLTSFGLEGANLAGVLHRVEIYYLFFFFAFITYLLWENFIQCQSVILAVMIGWIAIFGYVNLSAFSADVNDPLKNVPPSVVSGNIKDQFNFSLFKPYYW